jgi:hypothetical protein
MKKISTYSADRFPMAIFLGQMADYKFSPLLASTLEAMIAKNYFDSLCPLKAARLIIDFGSLFVPYEGVSVTLATPCSIGISP